jgi:hypothetical protein
MQIITRGWWPRPDEEATVDELERADRSLSGLDVEWTDNNPHQVRLSGRDRYWPVVCQIEISELQQDGVPPLSAQDCKSLIDRNLRAFRRIFAAKYKNGGFSEPAGPSGRPYRLVQLTREDIKASGENIRYEATAMGRFVFG